LFPARQKKSSIGTARNEEERIATRLIALINGSGNRPRCVLVFSETEVGIVMKTRKSRIALLLLAAAAPVAVGGLTFASLASGPAEASLVGPKARIDAAFSLLPKQEASVQRSTLDDGSPVNCAEATWPNIAPACLVRADGAPAAQVRVVSIQY
jgi:hypothetical protein